MTLPRQLPEDAIKVNRKGYNLHQVYLQIGDHLADLLAIIDLPLLDPFTSLSQDNVLRLALITVFQHAESLPDPIASEATLKRMDWKYALYLPAQHPGITAEKFSIFRHNLYASPKGLQEFDRLLVWLGDFGLYPGLTGRVPDGTAVLYKVCRITRIYRLNQAMKAALGALVSCNPSWLRAHVQPHWYERYKTGRELPISQADQDAIQDEAAALGADISRLLGIVAQKNDPELTGLSEIRRLAWLLEEEYIRDDQGLTWRLPGVANCSCNIRQEVMG